MKFLIVNSFHRDDKGDAALVHVLIDQLLRVDPYADIAIASMEDPREHQTFYKGRNIGSFELQSSSHLRPFLHIVMKLYLFPVLFIIGSSRGRFRWLLTKDLKKIFDEYRSADLVVSVGGGYFLTNKNLGSRMHLFFALQTMKLCKQLGRIVVTAPVSVGSFRREIEERFTARTLRAMDLVLLREDISNKYFVDEHGALPANIRREPDSAFAFSPEGSFDLRSAAGASGSTRVLAIAPRHWLAKREQTIYEQAHADLIDHIAEKYPDIRPVFISQCVFPHEEDDDRRVGERIIALSKTKRAEIILDDLDYQKVKLAYKDADFVVGTRFHSLVFALSYNVPGIAIEYEHKTRGIMRDLGLEEWVIPFGSVSSAYLIDLFDRMIHEYDAYRKKLLKVMPEYIASANKVADLFSGVMKR